MLKTTRYGFTGLLLLLAMAGCETKVCAGLPGDARTVPTEATIAVGEALTLRVEQSGYCAGQSPSEAIYSPAPTHWTTADTAVVSLDTLTGTVIGRRPGDAHVIPVVQFGLAVTIHVR